jgi:hypothetical protein
MEALILVTLGRTMFARIGRMRALNRHVERVFTIQTAKTPVGEAEAQEGPVSESLWNIAVLPRAPMAMTQMPDFSKRGSHSRPTTHKSLPSRRYNQIDQHLFPNGVFARPDRATRTSGSGK